MRRIADGFWYHGRFYPYIRGGNGEGDGDSGDGANSNDGNSQGDGASNQNNNDNGGSNQGGDSNSNNNRGDIQKALDAARAEERKAKKQLEEYQRREKEAIEKAAQEKGEYEKLYNTLKAESEKEIASLKGELFKRDAERELLAYLGEKHPSHVSRVRWLWPVLAENLNPDMDADAVKEAVKRVADEYVKDHPASDANNGGGAPGSGNRSNDKPPSDPLAKFPGMRALIDTHAPVSGAGGK